MSTLVDAQNYTILFVDDDDIIRRLVSVALTKVGYNVIVCASPQDAILRLNEATPALIISDINMPGMDGLEFLSYIRASVQHADIPLILLTARSDPAQIEIGFELGADDYLAKPFEMRELLARVKAKLIRPSVTLAQLPTDRQTGLLSRNAFQLIFQRELALAKQRRAGQGCYAYLYLDELPVLREKYGVHVEAALAKQISSLFQPRPNLDILGRDITGYFQILMLDTNISDVVRRLSALSQLIDRHQFFAIGIGIRLTPTIGFTMYDVSTPLVDIVNHATVALNDAAAHLDLRPVAYNPLLHGKRKAQTGSPAPSYGARLLAWARVPVQILFTLGISIFIPIMAYAFADYRQYDITPVMYYVITVSMVVTALLIWIEGFAALRRVDPPESTIKAPSATAIIAAYLPNEAATILDTLDSFLRLEYPAAMQIILAYNTPRDMAIEAKFLELAGLHPHFFPLRVAQSTSKAQNVNAALSHATGEVIGIFDADHHPEPKSFLRAWNWLCWGYDIVQGHCVVRNGADSWVARLVAVEFEAIYAIAHPGRERLHQFGIFGGSNGYWRADVLRATRMRDFMLTEDIDSSMRAIESGHRIASDPFLISRELAPMTISTLWNQRMRWAQGWSQVSRNHLPIALLSSKITIRQKLGFLHLLGWREVYPWISIQMFPLLGYWIWRGDVIDWLVPLFIMTTVFTLSVAPGESIFAYLRATPEIRQRRWWFLGFFLATLIWYAEWKNLIVRVAHLKELIHERVWEVTPRNPKTNQESP